MTRLRSLVLLGAMTLALAACSLEPRYTRPDPGLKLTEYLNLSEVDDAQSAKSVTDGTMSDVSWKTFLTHPELQSLVEAALAHNHDLRVSTLNIARSRALHRIQRSDLSPELIADGVEQVQKYPSGVSGISGQSSGTGNGGVTRSFGSGIGFTAFELDFFGRVRSLDHAALERYLGSIEARRSVQISLVAEVANAYLSLLCDQSLLQLATETLDSQMASHQLIRRSNDLGVADDLELNQAAQAIHVAEADVSRFKRRRAKDLNSLRLMLGASLPEDLDGGQGLQEGEGPLLENLPAGLNSSVLLQRPDVLAAEHELMAQNAKIGAARAAFFPQISLTSRYGTASGQLDGLFRAGSEAWTFIPRITLPIFSGGANQANLDVAKIDRDIAVLNYKTTVQGAFREVADALAARRMLDSQLGAEQRLVEAARTSYELAEKRSEYGVDNYLSVLDSQRTYYNAQKDVINTRLERLQNLVTLFKALGGGWNNAGGSGDEEDLMSHRASRRLPPRG